MPARRVFTLNPHPSVRLALLLLLPLIAITVPLLFRHRDTQAAIVPLRIRACLERVMSDGESPPPQLTRLWSESMGRVSPSRTWCGERNDRRGRSLQAIYDEATDRVILLSREKEATRAVSDKGDTAGEGDVPVRDTESAKAVAREFLRLLPQSDRPSWNLTAKRVILGVNGIGGDTWFVRGRHNRRSFDMRIEPTTGSILFYAEGKFTDSPASRALAPGL